MVRFCEKRYLLSIKWRIYFEFIEIEKNMIRWESENLLYEIVSKDDATTSYWFCTKWLIYRLILSLSIKMILVPKYWWICQRNPLSAWNNLCIVKSNMGGRQGTCHQSIKLLFIGRNQGLYWKVPWSDDYFGGSVSSHWSFVLIFDDEPKPHSVAYKNSMWNP